jgi:uncharacterized protein
MDLNLLNKVNTKKLDDLFALHHDIVFKKTECLSCANCCRNYSPIIEPNEIVSIQNAIGVNAIGLFTKYIEMDVEGDFVFKTQPCPMLDLETNKCTIYDDRPKACAEYPHTNMKQIKKHLDLLEKNIDICPAANTILENVMKELNNDKN